MRKDEYKEEHRKEVPTMDMIPNSNTLFTLVPRRPTCQKTAWQNEQYETYRLNFTIRAVRLHEHGKSRTGAWYAVDEYDLSLSQYHKRYALLAKYKNPGVEIFAISANTIVSVGRANRQGSYPGGGLQLEVLLGSPKPQHVEHDGSPKRVQY